MSETTPRPPSSPHPTRQQLDELEALMQRMLALPVNQLDDDPGPLTNAVPPLPELEMIDSAGFAATEPDWQFATPAGDETPSSGELEGLSYRLTVVREPVKPSEESRGESRPGERPRAKPQKRRDPPHSLPGEAAPVNRPRGSPTLRVLLWINRTFDRGTTRLGPIGRWLRGAHGRAWLGWMGLAFLATALVLLVLDVVGWTR